MTSKKRPAAPAPPATNGDALTVTDLRPDPANRRRRTARSAEMLHASLEQVGAARSIVIDEDNVVLAGNGLVDAATEVGISRVQVVEADGQTIIAVRRTGLSPEEKRALSMYDNRTNELSEWNVEQLADDRAHKLALIPFFTRAESAKLLREQAEKEVTVTELPTSQVNDRFWISIRGPLLHQAVTLQRLKELLKDLDVVVELGVLAEESW